MTDQLSYQIRRNNISREEGIKLVKKLEGKYPKTYMGKSLEKILNKINLTKKDFDKICDEFTNRKIFKVNQAGELIKHDTGSLIKTIMTINVGIINYGLGNIRSLYNCLKQNDANPYILNFIKI